jgi:hypothetical protein
MYDVWLIIGKNELGRDRMVINRVHEARLSEYVRRAQDRGFRVHIIRKLVPINKVAPVIYNEDVREQMEEEIGGY